MKIKQEAALYLAHSLGALALPAGGAVPGFAPVSVEMLVGIVQRIVAGVEPEKIILFGSYAYGTPTADSDLDLLVIMETTARPAERVLAVSRLLRPRPFPMDIIVRTPGEIAEGLEKKDGFIMELLSRGKVLYDRRG